MATVQIGKLHLLKLPDLKLCLEFNIITETQFLNEQARRKAALKEAERELRKAVNKRRSDLSGFLAPTKKITTDPTFICHSKVPPSEASRNHRQNKSQDIIPTALLSPSSKTFPKISVDVRKIKKSAKA